jgi:delta 1-pyrroline-5-carboxylate dehydrogenase
LNQQQACCRRKPLRAATHRYRFCAEQTITVNTTAAGGNVQLLASSLQG